MVRTPVWLSFANEDEIWAKWVRSHLESVGQGLYLEVHDHKHLRFGDGEEDSAVTAAINAAAVALPLVSRFI